MCSACWEMCFRNGVARKLRLPAFGGSGLLTILGLTLGLTSPAPLHAQTLVGQVLDESRESPVVGALVVLLDRDGEQRAQALSGSDGRFVIAPPEAGEYYLAVTRIGYEPTRSPLIALTLEGTTPIDLMMQPAPIGLEGFAVEVDPVSRATEELRISGIELRSLGSRWISTADIEAVAIKSDVGRILEWQGIGGMRVIRPENMTTGSHDLGLCISFQRARTGQGLNRCALIVLDGVPIRGDLALALDPESVAAMALLTPMEATILYGVRGEPGVLMIWTRRRGR